MLRKGKKQKPGSSASSAISVDSLTARENTAARSRRQYEITRDGAIVFFSTWKDISEATEVLAPLKATCGLLVRALEITKSINDNKRNLLDFTNTLKSHLEYFVKFAARDNAYSMITEACEPYGQELKSISKEVSERAETLKKGSGFTAVIKRIGASRIDVDQLKGWTDRLNAAHQRLTVSFQFAISHQLGDVSRDLKVIGKDVKSLSASRPAKLAQESLNRLFYGLDLDGCDSGTRKDILDRIRNWAGNPVGPKQVFWLSGKEGTGKTSIAATMYREWEDSDLLGGRFFFSNDAKAASTTHEFCHVVAQDLAAHIPSLRPTIEAAIKITSKAHFGIEQQLSKTIIEPLEQYRKSTIIVIDGLDVILDPHMRHRLLVCLMMELARAPMLKIFISSRPEMDMEEVLGESDLVERYVQPLNTADDAIDPDVALYIEKRLKNISADNDGQPGQKSIVASLSGGSFSWLVSATFLLKNSKSKQALIQRMSNADSPDRLDDLYHISLARIVHGMWKHGPELRMDILRVVVTALEPMSLRGLIAFLAYDGKGITHSSEDTKLMLQKGFGGLLKSGDLDAPVRIRHRSLRDFCINPTRAKEFCVDIDASHAFLAFRCLGILEPYLYYNVLDIDLPGDNPELELPPAVLPRNDYISNLQAALRKRLNPAGACISSVVTYSSSYWPYHVAGGLNEDALIPQVIEFLKTRFLSWVELMSWLGCIDEVVAGLSSLQVVIESHESSGIRVLELREVVTQALSFVQENREVIEHSALHVYSSALGLSTTNGALVQSYRELYKGRFPTALVGQRHRFEAGTSHPCNPLALEISPDGTLVALANRDFTVDLWRLSNTETRERQLSGHESGVMCLTFSQDSRFLASGSTDGKLWIWSLAKGSRIHLIEQDGEIARAGFSSDSLSIFVISINDNPGKRTTLRVWNIPADHNPPSTRFTCKEPFEVATFSPDGTRIAALTKGGLFEMHDARSGALLSSGSAEIHPSSIVLSSDGNLMAISDGFHIQLWNLSDPPVQTAEIEVARKGRAHALSMSPNGRYLIRGSTVWGIEKPSAIEEVPLWHHLPRALQQHRKGPGSLLSYENGWIYSAHPRGPLVEIPPYYDIHSETPWRAYGPKVVFAPESKLVVVDCSTLLR